MTRYIMKRIGMMLFVILGVLLFVFVLLYLTPGDPARQVLGLTATDEQVAAQRHIMGLDKPFLSQLGDYLYNLFFHFDLGSSYKSNMSVMSEIARRVPVTLLIGSLGVLLSLLIGIPLGILSAVKQYSLVDNVANILAVVFTSMPSFWLALELSLIFAFQLRWLPPSGFKGFQYIILPIITLGLGGAAANYRMARSTVLDEIRKDYVRTARAKGTKESSVILMHAVKNAMIPIITQVGNSIGGILGGAVVVENVFAIPGMGTYLVGAINARDYPIIRGGVLVICVFVSICNLATDIISAFIDPRIKSYYKKMGKRKERVEK